MVRSMPRTAARFEIEDDPAGRAMWSSSVSRAFATARIGRGLTGTELFVDRSVLPAEEEDEFYHADLVGLAVRDETGAQMPARS